MTKFYIQKEEWSLYIREMYNLNIKERESYGEPELDFTAYVEQNFDFLLSNYSANPMENNANL